MGTLSSAILTVVDDDGLPEVSFSAPTYSVAEGDSGSTNATITATLSAVSGQPVSVSYGTSDGSTNVTITTTLSAVSGQPVSVNYGTSTGSAAAGSDYTDTSGTLNFAAGDTEKTFTVSVIGDEVFEGE